MEFVLLFSFLISSQEVDWFESVFVRSLFWEKYSWVLLCPQNPSKQHLLNLIIMFVSDPLKLMVTVSTFYPSNKTAKQKYSNPPSPPNRSCSLLFIYASVSLFCPIGQAYLVHIVPVRSWGGACVRACVAGCGVSTVPRSRVAVADIWTLRCMFGEIPGCHRHHTNYRSPAGSPASGILIWPGHCSSVALWYAEEEKKGLRQLCSSSLEPCTNISDPNMFGAHTFRSLLEAQPAHCAAVAAVAADAGSTAGAGVQRDGPDYQGQGERQVQPTGDVHVYLCGGGEKKKRVGGVLHFLSHARTKVRLCQLTSCASAQLDKHPFVTEVGKEVSAECHNARTRRSFFFPRGNTIYTWLWTST